MAQIMCEPGLVPAPCFIPFPGFECIAASFICDGLNSLCPDGEEEANCAGGETYLGRMQ